MLKDFAKVTLKEKPFTKKDETGREFSLCKYWVIIDGSMFSIFGNPELAKEGDSVPLAVKASPKGSPILVFAKPL